MQDYFTCDEGYEEEAARVQDRVCTKIVQDLHHEQRLQCIINHEAEVNQQPCTKLQARGKQLTKEQYMARCPDWCKSDLECWEAIVDRWLSEDWADQHEVRRDCRLQMVGPPHHQGNLCLEAYGERWVMIFVFLSLFIYSNTQFYSHLL